MIYRELFDLVSQLVQQLYHVPQSDINGFKFSEIFNNIASFLAEKASERVKCGFPTTSEIQDIITKSCLIIVDWLKSKFFEQNEFKELKQLLSTIVSPQLLEKGKGILSFLVCFSSTVVLAKSYIPQCFDMTIASLLTTILGRAVQVKAVLHRLEHIVTRIKGYHEVFTTRSYREFVQAVCKQICQGEQLMSEKILQLAHAKQAVLTTGEVAAKAIGGIKQVTAKASKHTVEVSIRRIKQTVAKKVTAKIVEGTAGKGVIGVRVTGKVVQTIQSSGKVFATVPEEIAKKVANRALEKTTITAMKQTVTREATKEATRTVMKQSAAAVVKETVKGGTANGVQKVVHSSATVAMKQAMTQEAVKGSSAAVIAGEAAKGVTKQAVQGSTVKGAVTKTFTTVHSKDVVQTTFKNAGRGALGGAAGAASRDMFLSGALSPWQILTVPVELTTAGICSYAGANEDETQTACFTTGLATATTVGAAAGGPVGAIGGAVAYTATKAVCKAAAGIYSFFKD